MRRRAVALLCLLAGAALAVLVPTPAQAAYLGGGRRVMIVGDSLTHGFGGDWTWRYWLWREVQRQGADLRFVGPRNLPYDSMRYEGKSAWDSDHAALGGTNLDQQIRLLPGEIATYHPEVLVIQLGFNDVNHGDSADTTTSQLKELILAAQQQAPDARIVLAELPLSGSKPAVDAITAVVNARMATWAPAHDVEIAHNRTGEGPGTLAWDPARDTTDGVHPNATGQTLFAHRIAQALHRDGVLPYAPQGVYHQRTWAPNPRAAAIPSSRAVKVSWQAASLEIRMSAVKVLVDGVAKTGWLPVSATSTGVTLAVARGQHRVQLVPRRFAMFGAPGPAATITVS